MGLLDSLTGSSLDDPKTLGLLQLASSLSSGQKFIPALSQGLLGRAQIMQDAQRQATMREMQQMQMEQARRQAAQQKAQDVFRMSIPSPQMSGAQQALAGGGGPTMANAANIPQVDPNAQLMHGALQAGLIDPLQYITSQRKDNTPMKLGAGEALIDPRTFKPIYTNPKEDATPSAVREYNFAKQQGYGGSFLDFQLAQKRAGAPSTMVKVENKTAESLASQVGPMAKDSRIQTAGAVKMFDAANRLGAALDSNQVTAGPLASKVMTVKQLAQVLGGGNDESIRQTRQAIKSLAQMSVEARKQLQGQGQVTDSEAAAVAKADSGDINDLTTGELRDLVTLTKRAAHFQAKSHQELIGTLGSKDETKGLVPFYNVQGLDPLLKYEPTLPNIGGGWSIKPKGQ